MNSGEGFCEGFTMHLFTETCKKSLQHSILLWAFECNECSFQQALQVHISSAVSPFFLSSSFSCQRSWKDNPESVQKYHSSVGTCTAAAVHSELVTLWPQAVCRVISRKEVPSSSNDAGGFGDPFSQLQLVAGVWCLWRCMIWHFFQIPLLSAPGPALLCAWGDDLCVRASSAGSTLPAVFCIPWKQGVQPAAQRGYGVPTLTSMYRHSTNPDFGKPGTTLVHSNALVFSSHLSYQPLQCFNDHDIGLYLLL